MSAVALEFDDPAFHRDPYPLLHRLRREDPVHYRARYGDWVLTRYDDIQSVLGDPRFVASSHDGPPAEWHRVLQASGSEKMARALAASAALVSRWMVACEPPRHTRLRRLVAPDFSAERIAALRPVIESIVDDLLARAAAQSEIELVADFAFPLPMAVITHMTGIPAGEHFETWSRDIATYLDAHVSRAARMRGLLAIAGFTEHVRSLLANGPIPGNGLLPALVAARDRGLLDGDELLATSTLLLFAGHETTRHLIGNGVLALLRHPEQLQRLRAAPELINSAVEELLRYDSPGQLLWRLAREDVELGDKQIQRGQFVRLLIGAANRDPEHFADPDRLDIERRPNRHLAFGAGIHHCLGAGLARLEAAVGINSLLRRFPNLALATEPEWVDGFRLRGPRTLRLLV